jgi:hypothetical protein
MPNLSVWPLDAIRVRLVEIDCVLCKGEPLTEPLRAEWVALVGEWERLRAAEHEAQERARTVQRLGCDHEWVVGDNECVRCGWCQAPYLTPEQSEMASYERRALLGHRGPLEVVQRWLENDARPSDAIGPRNPTEPQPRPRLLPPTKPPRPRLLAEADYLRACREAYASDDDYGTDDLEHDVALVVAGGLPERCEWLKYLDTDGWFSLPLALDWPMVVSILAALVCFVVVTARVVGCSP